MEDIRTLFFIAIVSFLDTCPTYGVVEFKDGLTHDIDYTIIDGVSVDYQAPSIGTTVNLKEGGIIDMNLNGYERSKINFSAGSAEALQIYDFSQVNMSCGKIHYDFHSYDSSELYISGGSIGGHLMIDDASTITIDGYDFSVDGRSVHTAITSMYGIYFYNEPVRWLRGTLASGEEINNSFQIGWLGSIILVPEPTSAIMLALGGIFLVFRRR